jgi:hypothetical protein
MTQNLSCRWRSTYTDTYHYKNPNCFTPPEVYHQPPSIQTPSKRSADSHKFLPQYIPKLKYCRPAGIICNDPKALSLGTFDQNVKLKEMYEMNKLNYIQGGLPPKERRQKVLCEQNIKTLDLGKSMTKQEKEKFNYHNLVRSDRNLGCEQKMATWSTTTERISLQSALPMNNDKKIRSNLEKNADSVRYKASRYNINAEPWQKFSIKWDKDQTRHVNNINSDTDSDYITNSENSDIDNDNDENDQNNTTCNQKHKLVKHSQNRHIPGYSGYVPSLPIVNVDTKKPENTISNDSRTTTSMQRAFPKYNFGKIDQSKYARKEVMSGVITLVAPHNPFRLN